jgi:hypothetical protein
MTESTAPPVHVMALSTAWELAPTAESLRHTLEQDVRQVVHVLARSHADDIAVQAAAEAPPLYEVTLYDEPEGPSWHVARHANAASASADKDLRWYGQALFRGVDLLPLAFAPTPGCVAVLHVDEAFRAATGVPKLSLLHVAVTAVTGWATNLAARGTADKLFNLDRAHHRWLEG